MAYAFYFDGSACTGCKACQAACKDKNNLPPGVLWRRVFEVSGGGWTRTGAAWKNSVFAYNLSLSCNHCVHPKCAGVCPTDAYQVRPDGIVRIDANKCIGCGYCGWACPYDAPQLDWSAGIMTKCDLCFDYLDAGQPPACVAACPMRCLELVKTDDPGIGDKGLMLWEAPGERHPFPLPAFSRTEPHLLIKPHRAADVLYAPKRVVNREEIDPSLPRTSAMAEIPLIAFTLLAQTSTGAFIAAMLVYLSRGQFRTLDLGRSVPLLASGAAIFLALAVSFLHLGRPSNAWRVLGHLRKSWLSKEILFTGGFACLWAVTTASVLWPLVPFGLILILAVATGLCGLAAVYSMYSVYRLRSVPGWNSPRTLLEFVLSTSIMGSLLTGLFLPSLDRDGALHWITVAQIPLFIFAAYMTISTKSASDGRGSRTSTARLIFILSAMVVVILCLIRPAFAAFGLTLLIFLLALSEEILGRWLFYSRRKPSI